MDDWLIEVLFFPDTSGKLAKLGSELEKRAVIEARKARTGHLRARGLVVQQRVKLRADALVIRQLLVTLAIFQALTNECRRDVSLLTKALLVSVKEALQCLPDDLEVQARAASTVCEDVYMNPRHFHLMCFRDSSPHMRPIPMVNLSEWIQG